MSVHPNARSLRVLLVGRHFWPHASFDAAGFLAQLATDLYRSGVHVEVVTPRYAASWPEHFHFREIPVHRPAAAPRSDWSMGRYVRHLTTWLKENSGSFDLILADAIREESQAVIDAAAAAGIASVLISAGWGDESDAAWWQTSRTARRCAATAKEADAIVVKNAAAERMMIAQGFPQSQLHRIEIGFTSSVNNLEDNRAAARNRLAAVNSDLTTLAESEVVLCTGRMQKKGAMQWLASTARHLIANRPDLRFWFVGDGPERQTLYDFLRADGVRNSIAMPGSFVDATDLMIAADVFVHGDQQGLDFALPSAVSAAIPIVAAEFPELRSILTPTGQPIKRTTAATASTGPVGDPQNEAVAWFAAGKSKSLRIAIRRTLDDISQAKQRALQLRRDLIRSRPQTKVIEAYIDLMTRVVQEKSSGKSRIANDSNSIETAS
ncbi:glycosyltransferase [Novipirellula caenicola]|uniref:Glycosyltransferase subfamily 4-like N-terminal domain-containing protein n=1 Tax=Novipirellula caenicola TaxID=1536901 RepID=A0ABP9W083_9BACT